MPDQAALATIEAAVDTISHPTAQALVARAAGRILERSLR
jgi:hypothetical protein